MGKLTIYNNALLTIKQRFSQRSYDGRGLEEPVRERLMALCQEHSRGPFGGTVRFKLLDLGKLGREELKKLGTYGVIRGARFYILAAVKDRKRCMENLGYCMEKVILEATAMGLGTCWLGGTFRRSSFAHQMGLDDDELLPAITPVGYPAAKPTLIDRVMRHGAGSRRRKPWSELFFTGDPGTPLTEEAAGDFRAALEAVRQAPSASNRQPWRLIRGQDGVFQLYLKEDRRYNRMLGKIRLQNVDMGIAMTHFELAAVELGLAGTWTDAPGVGSVPGLEQIAVWLPT